jgi:hypothetical protein
MKRVISAFLLIIMAFVSIQTTWSWHYCGDILRSVTLANENSACCCGDKNKIEHNSSDFPQISKHCCSDYLIDIETDNFDLPDIAFETIQQVSNLFFVHHNSFELSESKRISIIQHIFPPGNFAEYKANLLALNCIFRI